MGNFSNNAITDVGRMLLADVQAGAVFTPTRIVIGSGSMTGGATVQGMTDVITPVKSLAINRKKRTPDGKCVFGGVYTNDEVTVPFYFRELALYAKAVYLNPDGSVKSEGPETLYSYGNAGASADYMPAYSTSTVVEKQMDLVIWVGNDVQVDLTIESGIYVAQKAFETHAARHALGGEDPITPASIGAAPAGYGLGEAGGKVADRDLNKVITIGFYAMPGTTAVNHPTKLRFSHFGTLLVERKSNDIVHQTVRRENQSAIRYSGDNGTTWSDWEYVNPQLEPGVEYRTTERRNGTPVFKMLGADGVLRYRLEGSAEWVTYAQETGAAQAPVVMKLLISKAGWYKIGTLYNAAYSGGCATFNIRGQYNNNWPATAFVDVVYAYSDAKAKTRLQAGNVSNQITKLGLIDSGGGMFDVYVYYAVSAENFVEITVYTHDHTFTLSAFESANVNESSMVTVAYLDEYENPTMAVGVEYRTTERYQGSPVYKKVDNNGNILWRAEYETSWHLLASASYVSPATVE